MPLLKSNLNNVFLSLFGKDIYIYILHLADTFIQSDLHCIQVTVFTFLSTLAFPGNRTHDLGVASAMLYQLSYRKGIKVTKVTLRLQVKNRLLFVMLTCVKLAVIM